MREPDHVRSLERGLAVLQAFSHDRPELTLAEVARHTGLTRATARRLLLTLASLGFVRADGRAFRLTPRVLDIGYAYLSSLGLGEIAQPHMETLVERTGESSSVAVLDGTQIAYVARVPTKRIMTISLGLGSRLPAHVTSMGRVLLAELAEPELDDVLKTIDFRPLTPHTLAGGDRLRAELERVRRKGWALVDQELELGVRSVAAPLRGRGGRAEAALNVSGHASRVTLETLRRQILPVLLETAERIGERLARR